MRLLLDENLPKRLKLDYQDHEIYTVRDKGWNGIKNGELLQLLIRNEFDALLTFDKNLQHQQNFLKYTITVFVLTANINSYEVLTELTPKVKIFLRQSPLPLGPVIIKAG
jgi:predicted nuclease of predicted toxin-antitoxin system